MLQSMGLQAVGHNWATEQQGILPGKGGGGSEAASLGVSQCLLRDAFVGSPSFPLRTFLGSGEGEGGGGEGLSLLQDN